MKIADYSISSPVTLSSKVIGTNVYDNLETQNFVLGDVLNLFKQNIDLQSVLNAGNTATQDITLTGDFTGVGSLEYSNIAANLILSVKGELLDVYNSSGSYGAKLVSNPSINGVEWQTTHYMRYSNAISFTATGNIQDIEFNSLSESNGIFYDFATKQFIFPRPSVYKIDLTLNAFNNNTVSENVYVWVVKNLSLPEANSQIITSISDGNYQNINLSWLVTTSVPNEGIKFQLNASTFVVFVTGFGVPGYVPDVASATAIITEI